MAKRTRKKANPSSDDTPAPLVTEVVDSTEKTQDALAADSSDITYTMGDIQVDEDETSAEDEEFKEASKRLKSKEDIENEIDDWVDEDFSLVDEDPFLDLEDFDKDDLDNNIY